MKLHAIAIAIVFAGTAGAAAAANPHQVLPRVSVSGVDLAVCTPPADARACDNFHGLIRANFSDREIGMLFGARTSYPEYLSGGYDRVRQRYVLMVQEYVAALPPASVEIAGR